MTGCRASLRGPASLGRNLCSGPLVLGLPEPVEQQAQAGLHPGQRPCLRGEMPGCRYQRRRSGARTADAVGRWPLISPERCFGREDVPLCIRGRCLGARGGCSPCAGDVPRGGMFPVGRAFPAVAASPHSRPPCQSSLRSQLGGRRGGLAVLFTRQCFVAGACEYQIISF